MWCGACALLNCFLLIQHCARARTDVARWWFELIVLLESDDSGLGGGVKFTSDGAIVVTKSG